MKLPTSGPFRLFLGMALVSNLGSWVQLFTEQWVVLGLAGAEAARWGGRLGFASGLAILIFTPFGGSLADRFDRRKALALAQGWLMLLALAMGLLALRPGGLTLPRLMGFGVASGIGAALSLPMIQGLIADLVSPEQIPLALGLWSIQFNISRILGPSLAALAFPWIGAAGNFLLNSLSFLGLVLVTWHLKVPRVVIPAGVTASYREGFKVFRTDPTLRKVLLLSVVTGLFAWPYFALLPVYGTRYLGVGERGVALLLSAFGLGAVLGGLWASRQPRTAGIWPVLVPFGLFGLGLGLLGGFPRFYLAAGSLLIMGIAQACFLNAMGSQVQWLAPPHLRGRANAIYLTGILGLLPLGNLASGEIAQLLGAQGPRWVMILDGVAMTWVAVWMGLLNLRRPEPNSH